MKLRKPSGLTKNGRASTVCTDAAPAEHGPATLAPEHRAQVTFVLEVVDLLAARYGFDPASLVNPRTGAPLGPELTRMRKALESSADSTLGDGSRPG